MDQQINTAPQPEEVTLEKKNHSALALIAVILVTAAVVAVICYLVLTRVFLFNPPTVGGCDDKLVAMTATADECQLQLAVLEEEKNESVTIAEETTEQVEEVLTGEYVGWNSFTDSQYGLGWNYPALWTVEESVISADGVMGKSGFCLSFSSPTTAVSNRTLLSVCYREQDDASSTTWFRTGMGYDELEKMTISLLMGEKTITQKTLFGDGDQVVDIIYAQNLAEDEAGFPARFASGDYFFSAMAYDLDYSDTGIGISLADQETVDKILASLEL